MSNGSPSLNDSVIPPDKLELSAAEAEHDAGDPTPSPSTILEDLAGAPEIVADGTFSHPD